jgi:hypothetical protein
LTNSYYSLTWVNAKFANETSTTPIDYSNTKIVEQIAQVPTLKKSLEKAIASVESWSLTKNFQSCRFCDTCGGDYPMYGGEGTGRPGVGFWYRYGDKCTGTLQEANSIPKLCCTAVPQCAWCSYCGGDYPEAVARKWNRGRYSNFKMLGMECSKTYNFRE